MVSSRDIKMILLFPLEIIWLIVYGLSSERRKIDMDLDHFRLVQSGKTAGQYRCLKLLQLLVAYPEFRTLFLCRLGKIRHLMKYLMPKGQNNLTFCVPKDKFGGGLYIQHGFSTGVSAHSIGENCWINQRVTIGFKGDGYPTIGNNVRIGVGAVIIGDVKIGNNVKIGANALVLHDVPDNSIVVSPEATILKRQGSSN